MKPLSSVCCITIDVHRGGGGEIKVFAKLVNKNLVIKLGKERDRDKGVGIAYTLSWGSNRF